LFKRRSEQLLELAGCVTSLASSSNARTIAGVMPGFWIRGHTEAAVTDSKS
jgi:hypothetical protein